MTAKQKSCSSKTDLEREQSNPFSETGCDLPLSSALLQRIQHLKKGFTVQCPTLDWSNKLAYIVAHLGTMTLVRRIAWHILILGSRSSVGAPGGRHRWQPSSLVGVAWCGDWYPSDRTVSCIVCGSHSGWRRRQRTTVIWIYTGGELWKGGRRWWWWGRRGWIGHTTSFEIAWAIRVHSVFLIIVNTAIDTVTIIRWGAWIGACWSSAVPVPELRAIATKPTRGRRQRT